MLYGKTQPIKSISVLPDNFDDPLEEFAESDKKFDAYPIQRIWS